MQVDLKKVQTLVEPIAASLGYEVVQVQWATDQGGSILRVLMDREGGVQVGDCQTLSREIETLLEVEGVVAMRYRLEVSSPGLNRPLVKETDFLRFTGKEAVVKTREPIEGRRNYKGLLQGVELSHILMLIDGQQFRIPIGLVEKAHLVF